jgi:hypothetical protein
MKTILFLSTIVTLIIGTTTFASAGPLGTYAITIKGVYITGDGSHQTRAKGTLKVTSVKAKLSVINVGGERGTALFRLSKAIDPTASTQNIKGTLIDHNPEESATFWGKLTRSGKHYKLTANMRNTDSEGVMKGTLSGTK